jgi:hypothetical protein
MREFLHQKTFLDQLPFEPREITFVIFDFTVRTQLRTPCVLEMWPIEYVMIIVQVQYNELVAFGSAARTRPF